MFVRIYSKSVLKIERNKNAKCRCSSWR